MSEPAFRRALERSRYIERAICEALRLEGWWLLPSFDYSGKDDDKAPRLAAPDGREALVLPDLLLWNDKRQALWAEVKLKSGCAWHERTRRRTTGICPRLWRHYHEVQRVTGINVWILFAHEEENEIRGATLDALDRVFENEAKPSRQWRHGMRFYRYDDIELWRSLDELPVPP